MAASLAPPSDPSLGHLPAHIVEMTLVRVALAPELSDPVVRIELEID